MKNQFIRDLFLISNVAILVPAIYMFAMWFVLTFIASDMFHSLGTLTFMQKMNFIVSGHI